MFGRSSTVRRKISPSFQWHIRLTHALIASFLNKQPSTVCTKPILRCVLYLIVSQWCWSFFSQPIPIGTGSGSSMTLLFSMQKLKKQCRMNFPLSFKPINHLYRTRWHCGSPQMFHIWGILIAQGSRWKKQHSEQVASILAKIRMLEQFAKNPKHSQHLWTCRLLGTSLVHWCQLRWKHNIADSDPISMHGVINHEKC